MTESTFPHKVNRKARWRITFPFFLLAILIFVIIAMIKWMFIGQYYFDPSSAPMRFMSEWDRMCNFNIL